VKKSVTVLLLLPVKPELPPFKVQIFLPALWAALHLNTILLSLKPGPPVKVQIFLAALRAALHIHFYFKPDPDPTCFFT